MHIVKYIDKDIAGYRLTFFVKNCLDVIFD